MEIRKLRSPWVRRAWRTAAWLTLGYKRVVDRLRPPTTARPPQRIAIFVRMELIGGAALICAVGKALKVAHPSARIYLIGRTGPVTDFLRAHSWIDEVIDGPRTGEASIGDWWRFYRALRALRLDWCVLSPNHSCSNTLFLYLCGIPRITGVYMPATWPWHANIENRFVTDQLTAAHMPERPYRLLDFPQAYARYITGRREMRLIDLVPFVRLARASSDLPGERPIVTFQIGGDPVKRWPAEGFAALGARIVDQLGAAIAIVGGPPDVEPARQLEAEIARPGFVFNRCGVPTADMLATIAHSLLYVGNNAGPLYLALALGTPIVGLFRRADERFSSPEVEGGPHRLVVGETVDTVSVEEVWRAVEQVWPRAPASAAAGGR